MRAVLQRVSQAQVKIDGDVYSEIGNGLLVYLGVRQGDSEKEVQWMARKIAQARLFEDNQGRMSASAIDQRAAILLVSQITLYGDLRKGNRPDLSLTMEPKKAKELYQNLISMLKNDYGLAVKEGQFQTRMHIHSTNVGPVTLLIDSPNA